MLKSRNERKYSALVIVGSTIGIFLLFGTISPFTVFAQTDPVHIDKPIQRLYKDNSLNWSGYYVTDPVGYTFTKASWIVPTISTNTRGYSSAWIGIGGVSGTGNLIQTGTDQDCTQKGAVASELKYHGLEAKSSIKDIEKSNSGFSKCSPVYYAWYEAYPSPEIRISDVDVKPGDVIQASVQQGNGGWSISITNISTGQTFTTTINNFNPDQTTAEAIMERPSLCSIHSCKLTDLADFDQIQFSDASATSATSDTFDMIASNQPITMVDNAFKILASPSSISNPGTFIDTWQKNK